MHILLASSEAVPFAKTGGLADVATALSKALSDAGHRVTLVLPHYPQFQSAEWPACENSGTTLRIAIGQSERTATLWRAELPHTDVNVVLVDEPEYFDRASLYQHSGNDFSDNCARFVFFSRTVLEIARTMDPRPDVIHCHDWQTGLIPALLELEYSNVPAFEQAASVMTIHNLAFQGRFWHWDMELTGLDWKHFNWKEVESYGELNLLKAGIVFADLITTVSPTYAREIQTQGFGCGLDPVLRSRADDLVGILNGVDDSVWNPRTDPLLARNFSASTVVDGKRACKAQLQSQLGLPQRDEPALFGMVSRMTNQKGLDLIAGCIEEVLTDDVQFAFLGTGDEYYQDWLRDLARRFPDRVSATIGFDEGLAHCIEAGADIYLMPSGYEPCGLNQMYSLTYGTVPIVHATGGLADSVIDATPENLANGTANGFSFHDYRAPVLRDQMFRAVQHYADKPGWLKLIQTGMNQDWSWNRSAAEYLRIYDRAIMKRQFATA